VCALLAGWLGAMNGVGLFDYGRSFVYSEEFQRKAAGICTGVVHRFSISHGTVIFLNCARRHGRAHILTHSAIVKSVQIFHPKNMK
jgi:hypothetical protein